MWRLPALNFPEYQFRLRKGEEFYEVWDPLRGQWLVLTPEEWVRQHLIRFLTIVLFKGFAEPDAQVFLGKSRADAS